jgi:DNA-binding transcriptional regulator GbsR (MarR family)
MMTEASKEAYARLKPKSKREIVYSIILNSKKGMTISELCAHTGWLPNELSGRITELRKALLIKEDGHRVNPRTNRKSTVWIPFGII